MEFKDCLTASCFFDQQVTSSLTRLIHGPWFRPENVEVGGGAAYSYLYTGVELWCTTTHYDTYAAKVEFIIKCKVYFP